MSIGENKIWVNADNRNTDVAFYKYRHDAYFPKPFPVKYHYIQNV